MDTEMPYYPKKDQSWEIVDAAGAGLDPARLAAAVAFAETHETSWPYDLEKAGNTPGMSQIEKEPWNEILGPLKPRGGPNGLVLRGGRIIAQWGDPSRVDMTFSIAKSYLAILTGLAVGDSLNANIDDPVSVTVDAPEFASARNRKVTWRHISLSSAAEWVRPLH